MIYRGQELLKKCKILIDKLDNINYMGSIDNGDLQILKQIFFFIFPTLNENFSHIIIELISRNNSIISKSTTPFDIQINEKLD